MKKLRLLSAAALTMLMVAAAPAMTSQAAMFTTCVPGNSSGMIINSGMLPGNFGQRGGQNFCGDYSYVDCLTGGSCELGEGNCLTGGSCEFGEGNCLTGGSCELGGGNCLTGGSCELGANSCQTGGSCQNGNSCQTGGNSCQGGNSVNTGWQNGIQTLPSFGGMPVAFQQSSCR